MCQRHFSGLSICMWVTIIGCSKWWMQRALIAWVLDCWLSADFPSINQFYVEEEKLKKGTYLIFLLLHQLSKLRDCADNLLYVSIMCFLFLVLNLEPLHTGWLLKGKWVFSWRGGNVQWVLLFCNGCVIQDREREASVVSCTSGWGVVGSAQDFEG